MTHRMSSLIAPMAQQAAIDIASGMGIALDHAQARDILECRINSWPFGTPERTRAELRQYIALNVFMDPGCRECKAHWDDDREFVEDEVTHFGHLTDASSPKAYRFYFSRFHNDGHRRAA